MGRRRSYLPQQASLDREGRVFQNVDPPRRRSQGSQLWALVGFVGLCLLVGASSAAINAASVGTWYPTLLAPPGNPPNWLFPPVWTVLYVLVGIAAWLVWRRADDHGRRAFPALRLWGWQLGVGALWTPAFFGLRSPGMGLVVILVLLAAIGWTMRAFAGVERRAAMLLTPYLAWVAFATYLNAGFWWLNGG